MSRSLELYCALREVNVPAEKARAVVDALKAATAKNPSTSRGKQSDALRVSGVVIVAAIWFWPSCHKVA